MRLLILNAERETDALICHRTTISCTAELLMEKLALISDCHNVLLNIRSSMNHLHDCVCKQQ